MTRKTVLRPGKTVSKRVNRRSHKYYAPKRPLLASCHKFTHQTAKRKRQNEDRRANTFLKHTKL